jgi:septation ring formation regulator EzrA
LTAEARRLHEGERSPEIEATLSRLREEIRASKAEAARLEAQAAAIDSRLLDTDELAGVVEAFDPLWQSLRHEERERLVRLLVKSIEYDAACESVSIAFRSDEAPAATEAM